MGSAGSGMIFFILDSYVRAYLIHKTYENNIENEVDANGLWLDADPGLIHRYGPIAPLFADHYHHDSKRSRFGQRHGGRRYHQRWWKFHRPKGYLLFHLTESQYGELEDGRWFGDWFVQYGFEGFGLIHDVLCPGLCQECQRSGCVWQLGDFHDRFTGPGFYLRHHHGHGCG